MYAVFKQQKSDVCKDGSCEVAKAHPCFTNPKVLMVMSVLQKVAFVALLVLAFYTEPELTGYFAAGGFVVGFAMHWGRTPPKNQSEIDKATGCSLGFLEEITGLRLPPPLGLVADAAIFYHHLEHCPEIFALLIGLNFGYKMGALAAQHLPELWGRIWPASAHAAAAAA
jgi:hypothetical protein